jgi:O-antigen/teichoic acid export membrane protein
MRSRGLGPELLGQYTAVVVLPATLVVFLSMGANVSVIHLVGSGRMELDDAVAGILLHTVLTSVLIVPPILFGILHVDARWVGQAPQAAQQFGVALIPISMLAVHGAALLQGEGRIKQYSVVSVLGPLLGATVLALPFAIHRVTLAVALAAWAVTQLAAVVLTWRLLGVGSWSKVGSGWRALQLLVQSGAMPYVANVMGFLSRRADVFLVAGLAGPNALGKYALAFMIAELLWYAASAAGTSLAPSIARAEESERRDITPLVARVVVALLTAGCLVTLLLDDWIVPAVFGRQFTGSIPALEFLLPGILAAGVEKVIAGDLVGRGRTGITAASAVVAVVSNLALNFILIPRFGIVGAAAASSLAYGAAALLTLTLYLRMTGTRVSEMLLLTRRDLVVLVQLMRKEAR